MTVRRDAVGAPGGRHATWATMTGPCRTASSGRSSLARRAATWTAPATIPAVGRMLSPWSGLDQLRRTERCGDGVGIAGACIDIYGGVGELDHVRVRVLDRPREDLPSCLLAG